MVKQFVFKVWLNTKNTLYLFYYLFFIYYLFYYLLFKIIIIFNKLFKNNLFFKYKKIENTHIKNNTPLVIKLFHTLQRRLRLPNNETVCKK